MVPAASEFTAESNMADFGLFIESDCLENRCGVTPQSVPGNLSKMAARENNDSTLFQII